MANDRMLLRCTKCQEKLFLLKFYPVGGPVGSYVPSWVLRELESFLIRHLRECHPHGMSGYLHGVAGFDVVVESPTDAQLEEKSE